MLGDSNKDMPVGTVLARIEQASKPFAAIFSLLHASMGQELSAVADMVADFIPEYYPYAVEGADQFIMASDFDDRVDVVPVSDPNITSGTQRIAQAQAVFDAATRQAQLLGPEVVIEAWKYLLEVLRIPQFDRFVPKPKPPAPPPEAQQPPPLDPRMQAEIARQDAVAQATIQHRHANTAAAVSDAANRKALAHIEIQRKAAEMQASQGAQRAGDAALIAQGQETDQQQLEREIAQLAAARTQQMEGQIQQDQVL